MLRTLSTLILTASLVGAATTPARAADPDFDCRDEGVSSPATPWFDDHSEPLAGALSATVLRDHIPQGLTTWRDYYGAGRDLLVYTAYHESNDDNRAWLQGVDQRDGSLTNYARIAPGHAGGVAIWGPWMFVSGHDERLPNGNVVHPVRRYSLAAVHRVFSGATTDDTLNGALAGYVYDNDFLAVEDGVLFAGRFNETDTDRMYRYRITADGDLDPVLGGSAFVRVPKKTQGVAVLQNYFFFSTSYGRSNRSNLYVARRGYEFLTTAYANGNLRCVRTLPMSEGITMSQGRAYLVFESGADWYELGQDGRDGSVRPTDRLHSATRTDVISLLP